MLWFIQNNNDKACFLIMSGLFQWVRASAAGGVKGDQEPNMLIFLKSFFFSSLNALKVFPLVKMFN